MRYRPFGPLKESVSEIGFGTWGLGGDAYGPAPEDESLRALRTAFDRGVTFYDTADLYGNGQSERLIAKAFKSMRKKIVVATKAGFLPDSKTQNFSADHLRRSLQESLTRLESDYVDVFQLHNPPIDILKDETVRKTLEDLRKSGQVRLIGISVRSPQDGVTAIREYGFQSVQVNFNMIDQRAIDTGLLDLAAEKKAGIVARTPLSFGFLTGKYSAEMPPDDLDHRTKWPKEQLERWAGAPKHFEPLYRKGPRTPLEVALRYCLSFPAVSTVALGMMTGVEVMEDLNAVDHVTRLEPSELEFIRKTYIEYFSAMPERKG